MGDLGAKNLMASRDALFSLIKRESQYDDRPEVLLGSLPQAIAFDVNRLQQATDILKPISIIAGQLFVLKPQGFEADALLRILRCVTLVEW